jgi:hypothetical protein
VCDNREPRICIWSYESVNDRGTKETALRGSTFSKFVRIIGSRMTGQEGYVMQPLTCNHQIRALLLWARETGFQTVIDRKATIVK